MSFQLKKIYIYSNNKESREIEFKLNSVNIITGASKTGKSAIIHIVSYCLGSKTSLVPAGIIPKKTSWFAILLVKGNQELFIARKNPVKGNNSSEDVYIEKGKNIKTPIYDDLKQTSNIDGLETILNTFCGIKDYSATPKPGQTRKTGNAGIGKASIYCFQEQGEIANKNALFHRQSEPFLFQSIKDYLPFFLGAVDSNIIYKQEELRKYKNELKKLEEIELLKESENKESFVKAHSLISEAISVGLLENGTIFPNSWNEIRNILNKALNNKNESRFPDTQTNIEIDRIYKEQEVLREDHRKYSDEINYFNAMESSGNGFSQEGNEQKARLESINILPNNTNKSKEYHCPLCSSNLTERIPTIELISKNLTEVNNRLEGIVSDIPHIHKLKKTAVVKQSEIKDKLIELNEQLNSIQENNKKVQEYRDLLGKQSLTKGRISYYSESIESYTDEYNQNPQIPKLKLKIEKLEKEISVESLEEKLNSILSRISNDISKAAKKLKLEHSQAPFRLDSKKLTVIADTEDGPVPLYRMGSGDNWVSIHLITYLVLQKWFSKQKLPVPRFVIFDQPTQAFFPPQTEDIKIKNTDKESVFNIFKFIEEMVKGNKFQVIVTDHADLPEKWYQNMIIEKWWDGKTKLIPFNW